MRTDPEPSVRTGATEVWRWFSARSRCYFQVVTVESEPTRQFAVICPLPWIWTLGRRPLKSDPMTIIVLHPEQMGPALELSACVDGRVAVPDWFASSDVARGNVILKDGELRDGVVVWRSSRDDESLAESMTSANIGGVVIGGVVPTVSFFQNVGITFLVAFRYAKWFLRGRPEDPLWAAGSFKRKLLEGKQAEGHVP